MSDNESFVSIENDEVVEDKTTKTKTLDNFLDFNIEYMTEEEKCNYIAPKIINRNDIYDIKNEKIIFLINDNLNNLNNMLNNKSKEEIDIFIKLKKDLFNIAYNNEINKDNKNFVKKNLSNKSTSKEISRTFSDYLSNDFSSIGNKIEDTYNDIKNSVNWIGNFFTNNDTSNESKRLNIFYSDLYFFNDITIIRYLDTYKYNIMKTLNKIIKCILWRQMCISNFNEQKLLEENKENNNEKNEINNIHNKQIFINPKYINYSILNTNIYRCGFDIKSRPILYIKIQEKLNIKENDLFLTLIYHVDMCINSINYIKCYQNNTLEKNNFDESILQLVIVVDCLKFDLNNMISVDCIKKIITTFNEFYTDVLYRIYVINVPSFFKKVWGLFNMFIDNHTLNKIIFVNKNNINMMYEHLNEHIMKHFNKSDNEKNDQCTFFPSPSLYYNHELKYYDTLMSDLNLWVENMIKINN